MTRELFVQESISAKISQQNDTASTMDAKYKALGYATFSDVASLAASYLGGQVAISGRIFTCINYSVDNIGGDAWDVTLSYESPAKEDDEEQDPLKRSRSFDTQGSTTHMNVGLSETRFPATAPDMKAAIGVDGETIAGVDVTIPALSWTETYEVGTAYVSLAYIKSLSALTGTTNSAAFRGFAAGEVLFLGCSGSQQWDSDKGDGPWTLAFKFSASQNVTNMAVGPVNNVSKKGHEYLWAYYGTRVQNNTVFRVPQAVYVTKLYKSADFGGLGIGT